jgi:chitinase
MAWSLGEDSFDWSHIAAMSSELAKGGYGSGEPSAHHSQPMIPAAAPATESGPVDPKAPIVESVGEQDKPLNVVWVDGTPQGPAGDHSTESAAPSDFTVPSEEASTPQTSQPLMPAQPPTPPQSRSPHKETSPYPQNQSEIPEGSRTRCSSAHQALDYDEL